MLVSVQRAVARTQKHAALKQDPFLKAFRKCTVTLDWMLEVPKTFGGTDESPELMRVWPQWSRQLDRLVELVPTTIPGVIALTGLCLDRESLADDDDLLIHHAMWSIANALKNLFPGEPWPARCGLRCR